MGEKICINEYVRTYLGRIGKITQITDEYIFTDIEANCIAFTNCNHFFKETFHQVVSKHSKNIIDLIEAGDYVNGYKVMAIYLDGVTKYIKLSNAYENGKGVRTYAEDIKSILTKEQFTLNCYRLEK